MKSYSIVILLIFLLSNINVFSENTNNKQAIKNIKPKDAVELVEKNSDNQNFIILDVRTPGEYSDGHVENAVNIDFYSDDFKKELDGLDKTKKYFVYCRSGNRSGQATNMMKKMDFKEVYNLSGGISDLAKAGMKIVK